MPAAEFDYHSCPLVSDSQLPSPTQLGRRTQTRDHKRMNTGQTHVETLVTGISWDVLTGVETPTTIVASEQRKSWSL